MPPRRSTEPPVPALRTARTKTAKAPPGGNGEKPEYRVEALAKGLRLLSLFDEQRPVWRVTDLAAEAGIPVPTTYRRGVPVPPAG